MFKPVSPFRRSVSQAALAAAMLRLAGGAFSAEPLVIAVVVQEGNYRVTVKLGDAQQASSTTVKSENRRLMLEDVATAPGEFATRAFLVNVHTPRISPERSVRLKPREIGILRWDERLTLEFSGSHPAVCGVKNYTRLLKEFIATARQHDATPVLVTPMHRLKFDAEGKVEPSLGDYPEAMRRVARDEHVNLIDLNAMSREYYESMGPEKTQQVFVDQTHSNESAAYEFARYIAAELKRSDLDIARDVVDDLPPASISQEPSP